MAKQIPLTLMVDNNNTVSGIKEFSEPAEECLPVEHGGTGRINIEDNYVLVGNDTNPVTTIQRKSLVSNDNTVSISGENSLISNSVIEIQVDNSKLDIANILTNQSIPINRIGRWVDNYQDWEGATDELFLEIIDPGEI